MRIAVGTDSTVTSPTFVAADGETGADTAALPLVTVTREDGTVLAAPLAVQGVAGDGVYTTVLTAAVHATRVDLLTLTWTGTVAGAVQTYSQQVEVVGGFYVSLAELRAMDDLGDMTKFPTSLLRSLRDEFQNTAEGYCEKAFVPRYAVDELYGRGSRDLLLSHVLPRSIIAASVTTVDGSVTPVTVSAWRTGAEGAVTADNYVFPSAGFRNVTVRYSHGDDTPPPDLVQACKEYVRAKALERRGNRHGRDVLSQIVEGVTIRFSTPDWAAGRPTGALDIDRVLNSLGSPSPKVG